VTMLPAVTPPPPSCPTVARVIDSGFISSAGREEVDVLEVCIGGGEDV